MREIRTKLLFRSSFSSQLGHISMAGLIRDAVGISNNRVLGSYALVYLLDGGGTYSDANGLQLNVAKGDFILIFPELAHNYGPKKGGQWTEIYFVFEGPLFDLWRKNGLISPDEPLHHATPVEHWLARLEGVLGAPHETGLAPSLLEVTRFQQVLVEMLFANLKRGGTNSEMQEVARARTLLESDLEQKIDMDRLGEALGLKDSFDSFRKRFTKMVGMPPAKYRSTKIIDRACHLMVQGSLSDKQISERLGFYDEFHFSRRFKEIMGCSPRSFRRRVPGI